MTGHLLGAAGVLEAIFSILAIRDNVAPPTINYRTPDPDCDLDFVPNTRAADADRCGAVELLRVRRHQWHTDLPPLQRLNRELTGTPAGCAARGAATAGGGKSAALSGAAGQCGGRSPGQGHHPCGAAPGRPVEQRGWPRARPRCRAARRKFSGCAGNLVAAERGSQPAALDSDLYAARQTGVPFAPGWVVFVGYEIAADIEPHLMLPPTPLPWTAFALRTPCALVHVLASDAVWAVAEPGAAGSAG